jgi:hypothetical protein
MIGSGQNQIIPPSANAASYIMAQLASLATAAQIMHYQSSRCSLGQSFSPFALEALTAVCRQSHCFNKRPVT